ncbi:hypothetical protein BDA96_03G209900 [Sorghum bicolor]|uniref:Uncharacterized protein n=1 Tax=Sorghum bicolor TaxID=4558 RepID=A0A921RDP1_SORBI|nr:hypothetical protein BDA96_03G209900 [Sorghum bicolor]
MARAHPTSSTSKHRPIIIMASSSSASPALLHVAWITAVVAVCLALCTIHSRKPSSSSSSSTRRRRGSRSASSSSNNHRCGSRESNGAGSVGTAATTPAKVSPTPSDTAKASGAADVAAAGPVTVIDVGTHGPIPPAFLPPDPLPPRRSLSSSSAAKHTGRIGRIRSMRRGGSGSGEAAAAAAEDDVFVGCQRGGEVGEEGTLWTKTIILGERCRVPSGSDDEDGGVDGVMVNRWKSYRPPRQPRSVPVTRSNSFAGVGSAGARRPTNPRF